MNVLTCERCRRREDDLLFGSIASTRVGSIASTRELGGNVGGGLVVYAPKLLRSGGTAEAFPMPLGSLSALGLAGPKGTPLIGALPAPADPAGGVSESSSLDTQAPEHGENEC